MAVSPKFVQMIEHLTTATEQGRLQWEESDDDDFLLDLARSRIRIAANRLNFDVTLYDGKGKILELETFSPDTDTDTEQYWLVDRLYSSARRSGRKIDDVIDQVISEVTALPR